MDRGAWQAIVHVVARVRHDLMTKKQHNDKCICMHQIYITDYSHISSKKIHLLQISSHSRKKAEESIIILLESFNRS